MENNTPKTLFDIPPRRAAEIASEILAYIAMAVEIGGINDNAMAVWIAKRFPGKEAGLGLFTLGRLSMEHTHKRETGGLSAVQECINFQKEKSFVKVEEFRDFLLQEKFLKFISENVKIEGLEELLNEASKEE
jgi:hypothetical protein